MSLREEIWLEFHKFYEAGRRGDSYDGLPESNKIINTVLDAAVEAARTRHRGEGAFQNTDSPMGWEFNAGIREAITEINKLRGKS